MICPPDIFSLPYRDDLSFNDAPRIVWIGKPFFSPAFTALNVSCRFFDAPKDSPMRWDDIVRMAGEPDLVVVADASRPPFVLGVEDFPCPTVFYAVDTHIHSWYPFYAQAFDACMVSLRDHCQRFYSSRLSPENVWWFPPYARDTDSPRDVPQVLDVLFAGSMNPVLMPRRWLFFEKLQTRVPGLVLRTKPYYDIFPTAKIVLNYAENNDLNFRTFEALGCGSCLITPHVEHGFRELFTPGRDCVVFCQDDLEASVSEVAAQIHALLQDTARRQEIAVNGLTAINARHRARHRALAFLQQIRSITPQKTQERRAQAAAIRAEWLKMPYLLFAANSQGIWQEAYLRASRGI